MARFRLPQGGDVDTLGLLHGNRAAHSLDTVDGTVIEALNTKSDVQDAFFDLLNRIKGRITKRMKAKKTELWDDEDD